MLRFGFASASIIIAIAAGHAAAGTVTVTFDPLAADAGRVVSASFDTGAYGVTVSDALITDVSGVVGVAPQDPSSPGVTLVADGGPITVDAVSATFGGPAGSVSWAGQTGFGVDGADFSWPGAGQEPGSFTPPGTYDTTFEPAAQTSRIELFANAGNGGAITSVTISAATASIPEPPGLTLAAIAAGLASLAGALRGRKGARRARI